MKIDTSFLERCIATLDKASILLSKENTENIDYDIYKFAAVKEYEIILEQSGKLLKKALTPYFSSSLSVDKLTFKDLFRNALQKNIITDVECERWLNYRENRNNTAHEYGINFAEETIELLPSFILDATQLCHSTKQLNAD
ncbi:MAG: nucleotidyltransferase substrate binding protein [Bacteroidia bacterium]|nr:nucleotidyltransferase substrate binding protein [Bacteroidia bacterium]